MKRLDLKMGFQCNNHCVFCVQGDKRYHYPNRPIEEIKSILKQSWKEGCDEVVFTGGEPTLRKELLLEAVAYAHKLGYKPIQIQTNGRVFAYLDYCKEIIRAGADDFSPALHGSTAAIHDKLTRSPGSFDQTVQGIKNLVGLRKRVMTNTVITKINYKDLPNIARLLVRLGVDQFQCAFIHINNLIAHDLCQIEEIVPRVTDVMPYVKEALDIGKKAGVNCMTEAIPYCLMAGYETYIAEQIIPDAHVFDANIDIKDYATYRRERGKAKGSLCIKCKHNKICEGPWREYPDIFGWGEFRPVVKTRRHAKNDK
ncbi:MAG: radical SAM protein [Patescibacteria group bacterium]|nr:radical SAM protein [Patescibacteria group bacterium]MCL5261983.1 radical SAM protein [Patescibacteria group bacterium]